MNVFDPSIFLLLAASDEMFWPSVVAWVAVAGVIVAILAAAGSLHAEVLRRGPLREIDFSTADVFIGFGFVGLIFLDQLVIGLGGRFVNWPAAVEQGVRQIAALALVGGSVYFFGKAWLTDAGLRKAGFVPRRPGRDLVYTVFGTPVAVIFTFDTLVAAKFADLSRLVALPQVLEGIAAAKDAGLKVKLNAVALKGVNEDEIEDLIAWAHSDGHDVTLIEVMPLGDVEEERLDQYLPLDEVKSRLERRWTLDPTDAHTGGPARYWDIAAPGGRLGLIAPHTGNFCEGCNRLRVTATGQLYPCLGGSERVDLRAALRSDDPETQVADALNQALMIKPEKHHFRMDERGAQPHLPRHMSMTGG